MSDYPDYMGVGKGTDKFLESSIKHHKRRLLSAIKSLENNIIDMAADFKTTDGILLGPRVNMKQAQKVHARLTSLFDETYGAEARQVVKGFNPVIKRIKKDFKSLNVAMDYTSVDKDMIKTLKKNAWKNFQQFGLQTQEKLVDVMYNSILGKQSFSSMVNDFSGILSGHRSKKGRPMSAYAELYAHDAIMDFHNAVNIKKSEDLGFEYFLYYGNVMSTTRDFCRNRVGKVFSKEDIESWDFKWAGKSGPALINRGGYNCRHHWRAVRKSWVKEDQWPEKEEIEQPKKVKKHPVEQFEIPASIKTRIQAQHDASNLLIQSEWEAEFLRLGHAKKDIQEAKALLQAHGSVASIQTTADEKILKHFLDKDSKVGSVLRTSSDMEEKAYLTWKEGASFRLEKARMEAQSDWDVFYRAEAKEQGIDNFDDFWNTIKYKYEEEPSMVYRGGSIDIPIQSWTTNPAGAWTGGAKHIQVDHMVKIDDMLTTNKKPLGGFCRMMGAPGESEITFIDLDKAKKIKKAKKETKDIPTLFLSDIRAPKMEKFYHEIVDNPKQWELNYGLSENTIFVFDNKGKVAGYAKFTRVSYDETILTAKFDVRKNVSNKSAILRKLLHEIEDKTSGMKGLKKFSAEYATVEGERSAKLIAKRLGLEFVPKDVPMAVAKDLSHCAISPHRWTKGKV